MGARPTTSLARGVSPRASRSCAIRLLLSFTLTMLAAVPRATTARSWRIYGFANGAFISRMPAGHAPPAPTPATRPLPSVPFDWHVAAATLADVTGDDQPEWALLVWRPWQDWPIQKWVSAPSPITGFHDAAGDSCHLILLDPHDGREIWAGSALPAPLLALATGDVDGDGINEIITLEGDYARGRRGPAGHLDVWEWNGFGFSLQWRSPPDSFCQLRLTDDDNDGILDIAVR